MEPGARDLIAHIACPCLVRRALVRVDATVAFATTGHVVIGGNKAGLGGEGINRTAVRIVLAETADVVPGNLVILGVRIGTPTPTDRDRDRPRPGKLVVIDYDARSVGSEDRRCIGVFEAVGEVVVTDRRIKALERGVGRARVIVIAELDRACRIINELVGEDIYVLVT